MLNRRFLSIFPHSLRNILGLNNPYTLSVDERKITIPIDIPGSFSNLFLNKSWKTNIISHSNNLSNGAFIDVGANLGQTLIEFWMSRLHSNAIQSYRDVDAIHQHLDNFELYIGFEPNQRCVRYLKSIIEINSLNGYKIIPNGLFNEDKSLSLYKQNNYDSCATVVEDLRPSRKYDIEEVVCQKFDDVFTQLDIENINLIKIDVEGSELEVLQGMSNTIQRLRPPILCEVLFTDKKADLSFMQLRNKILMSLLNDWNYSTFQIMKSGNKSKVERYKKISQFTSEFWSLKNMDLCDYLFIPVEHEEKWIGSVYSLK